MKRIITIILTIMLMFGTLFTIPASAAGGVNLTVESKTAKQGDTVSVSVKMTANSGFSFLMVTPEYDKASLTLTKTANGTVCVNMTDGKNPIWNGNGANVTATGTLVTFTFKIDENAAIKDYSVTITLRQCYDVSSDSVPCNSPVGTISVGCKAHSFGSWTTVKNATCTAKGEEKRVCSACGYAETRDVNAHGHKFSNWTVSKAPTCTEKGQEKRICTVCGANETRTINTLGHNYGSWKTIKEPTCTTSGKEERACTRCSAKESREIKSLGHNFTNPTVTKHPTCTEPGIESGKCTRCGKATTQEIKAIGHKFGAWTQTKAATCTEKGTEERTCSACGNKETRAIEALGHDFENPVVVKEATISSTGLMEGKCKRCGETTQEVIPCQVKDETTGVSIESNEGVFAEGTTVKISDVSTDDSLKTALTDYGTNFNAYLVDFIKDGAAVKPNGEYKLVLPNNAKLTEKNIVVCLVTVDGTVTEKEFILNEDGTISVTTAESGTYAVIDKSAGSSSESDVNSGAESNTNVDAPAENNNVIWIIIAIATVVVVAGGIVTFILLKKKKSNVK